MAKGHVIISKWWERQSQNDCETRTDREMYLWIEQKYAKTREKEREKPQRELPLMNLIK
jgi:hypothetical protein